MILRFPDVLRARLASLHAAFRSAIAGAGYRSRYQGVFPIKVNQSRDVIRDLVRFGRGERYGLEAGTKPELLVAMGCLAAAGEAAAPGGAGAYLVCNGYKDPDYVALALSARALGLNCIIVLEMEEELDIVVEQSARLGVEPALGIRAKLLTKIEGHFGSTAGKRGKFGLLEEKVYGVAEKLRRIGKLHWLTMLHFHIGSMIPTAETVRRAAAEAAGIYCNLAARHGAPMTVLDCGGGLGVDYDGTRGAGDSDMSVAYGLEEYAAAIVEAVRAKCDEAGVAHPVLCTESGRAMVTHHSMIILEALSAIPEPPEEETTDQLLRKIQDLSSIQQPRVTAAGGGGGGSGLYSHAAELQKQGIEMYKLAKKVCKRVTADAAGAIYNYHMNLSVFSLVADYWGVGQLFPMMPVSRLDERPTLRGTLVDITCDSDGKINKFIGGGETLPLHPLDPERGAYYVAVLLSGSYQEALACKHNLFSGPTLVRVESAAAGGDSGAPFKISTVEMGPTTDEIIGTMGFDVKEDIGSAVEELAKKNNLWVNVEPLMTKVLTTMPYLNEYKAPKTT